MSVNINNNFGIVSTGDYSVNNLNSNSDLIKELNILQKILTDKEEVEKIILIKRNLNNKDKLKNIIKSLKKETTSLVKSLTLKILESFIMKYI